MIACNCTQSVVGPGFVTILGSPNVGKSTLMNRLVGEKLSIVSPKSQTTRHQIMGVVRYIITTLALHPLAVHL